MTKHNINLNDATLNSFAQGLVARFIERATGQEAGSARLINERPADHILTGFLNPAQIAEEDGVDDPLADDLPRDDAYNQSSLGMHWLVPRSALREGIYLQPELSASVYVRRLPTVEEQQQAPWSVPRNLARAAPQG